MDERNARDSVIRNLIKLNIRLDDLKKGAQYWLFKIDDLIYHRVQESNECIDKLKSISFDVSSIAKELHTSRQNLYNSYSGILKQYIEVATSDIPISPIKQIEKLREEKASLQQDKEKLMLKDLQTEILEKELDEITVKFANANKQHQADFERIMQLQNEVLELKKKLASVQQNKSTDKDLVIY